MELTEKEKEEIKNFLRKECPILIEIEKEIEEIKKILIKAEKIINNYKI